MIINSFYPDRHLTKFEYLRRGALILPLLVGVVVLGFLKFNFSTIEILFSTLIVSLILLSFVLTSRFTTEIQIDAEKKTTTILYFTLLKNKEIVLQMDALSYTLKHSPTFRDPGYWLLILYTNNSKAFVLDNRHGYTQSVLQSVAEELQLHQVPKN